jgi:TonB-dependent SusC/RagA subfamily outer membrane receptor
LDNLLLTQGWRRFIWKDVLANNFQAFNYREETGIGISGTVSDRSGNPAAGARVSVLLNSGAALLDTVTNANGQFMFDNLILKKGTNFNLTAVDAKGRKNVKVELDKQAPDPVVFDDLPLQQPVNNGLATYLKNDRDRLYELNKYGMLEHSILLKEVSIKDAALKNSASLAGAGHADQVLTFMDLLGCQQDFTSCLRGRLTNVHFVHDTLGNWTPYARNFDFPMLIVVDGVIGRHLEDVVAPDVASVEVLRGGGATALYGMKAGNGVIIITTKKGDVDYRAYEDSRYNNDSRSGGLAKYKFTGGYDLRRQFYMPDYDNPATIKQMADLRSTIYWNPNIMATENGKASVDFFNADGVGNYRVIIEGLDLQGRLARQVYYYKVN